MPSGQNSTAAAKAFLDAVGIQGQLVEVDASQPIYRQGNICDGVLYVLSGSVRLTVGKHRSSIATVGAGQFFGEGCLTGQTVRLTDAIAETASTLRRISAEEMSRLIRTHPAGSEQFVTDLLRRSLDTEQKIVRCVFSVSERRLAKALIRLAIDAIASESLDVAPAVTDSGLVEIAGGDRPKIRAALSRFQRDGLIERIPHVGSYRVEPPLTRAMLRE